MRRLLVTALTALLLMAAPPATAATPEQRYASTAHTATNQARAQEDLGELGKNACLTRFAVRQAKRMAARREMYHQDLGPVLQSCGMGAVGENVAYGFRTGTAVVREGWMHSEGHRANILSRDYRLMGIGARKAGGQWYVAQVFGRK
jgi:uncharacterized protein YkwD